MIDVTNGNKNLIVTKRGRVSEDVVVAGLEKMITSKRGLTKVFKAVVGDGSASNNLPRGGVSPASISKATRTMTAIATAVVDKAIQGAKEDQKEHFVKVFTNSVSASSTTTSTTTSSTGEPSSSSSSSSSPITSTPTSPTVASMNTENNTDGIGKVVQLLGTSVIAILKECQNPKERRPYLGRLGT